MIHYIEGDLLETPRGVILHGCNCRGVMGAGVALAIRNKWPKVYEQYKAEETEFGLRLGTAQKVVTFGKVIFNCLTQQDFGTGKRFVSYDAVAMCLSLVRMMVPRDEIIAMPRMGAGLAGGDWDVIEAIINSELKNHEVFVYVK